MKPKSPQSKVSRLILEEAAEWFVDFRVDDLDAHARERFDEWLRRSPEHIRAYMEIAKTYVELPSIKLSGKTDVDALIAYAHSGENVVAFNEAGGVRSQNEHISTCERDDKRPRTTRTSIPRLRRRIVVAASCAMLLVIAGAAWWNTERFLNYATDAGERRSITLADGSTVDLNAQSRVRIKFSNNERRVELVGGQALFQVAKDKNRPFIVSSGNATVRAVGTQFDVDRKANGTTVTVLEGRVAVYSTAQLPPKVPGLVPAPSPNASSTNPSRHAAVGSAPQLPPNPPGFADPSNSAGILLSAGEQVTVTPVEVARPQLADITVTTAWMQRHLVFDGTRLGDVVQEFNRYNRRHLIIEGAQLSDFHVSGVYSSSDPSSLIRFLLYQPGIKITEDDNEIRIAPR